MPDKTITIETVAEVQAVHRETIEISIIPASEHEAASIHLMQARYSGDLQFISLPAAKADEFIAAIRAIQDPQP